MITVGKVRNAEYYLAEVFADDAFNYYGDLDRSGRWAGRLAADLGLTGEIEPDDFARALEGRNPNGGARLTETRVSTTALDVTLSVPKSFGVIWALGDPAVRAAMEAALDDAQAAVIGLLEAEGTKVRRGHAGAELQPGEGLLVAAFAHTTSRSADPQPHRHLVIFNATTGPDGRRTALATRELYRLRYTAEAVFQAQLRYSTARTLGLHFGPVDRHGVAEVDGVPDDVRAEFSRRRADIKAEMANRGVRSWKASRLATLATRKAKGDQPADDVLRADWHRRAARLGFSLDGLATTRRTPTLDVSDDDICQHVTAERAHFAYPDVLRAVACHAVDGAELEPIRQRAHAFLASPDTIALNGDRYTTREILDLETGAVDIAVEGENARVGTVRRFVVDHVIAKRPALADEQIDLVRRVTTSGNQVDLVIGKAGAGKTYALDAVRDAYETAGYQIVGAALAARAAAALQAGSGIPTQPSTADSLPSTAAT